MEVNNKLIQHSGGSSIPQKAPRPVITGDVIKLSPPIDDGGMAQINALKKLSENQPKSEIESLEKALSDKFERITNPDTTADEASKLWSSYVKDSEEYLKKPESFDRKFGNFLHTESNHGNVKIVGIQAPWPITGTMDQWCNFIQEKNPDGSITLTPLQTGEMEENMTRFEDVKIFDNNGKTCMALIGRAKADGTTGAWEVSVSEKGDNGWTVKKDAFNIKPGQIGGREMGISEGVLWINDDHLMCPGVLPSFGNNNQILFLNEKDNSVTALSLNSNGNYILET